MNTLSACKMITFIPSANRGRAREFYKMVLGLRLVSEDEYALMFEVAGTYLRIINLPRVLSPSYTLAGWKVPNIGAVVEELSQKGIRFERYAGFEQDKQGIWTSGDGARVAWFKDPDGNILSLTQFPTQVNA